jgi:hypothetical protein
MGQEACLGECAEALRRRNSDVDHLQVPMTSYTYTVDDHELMSPEERL